MATLADVLAKEGITETAFSLMTPEAQQQIIRGAAVKYPEFDMNTGLNIGNITNTAGNISGGTTTGSWIPGLSNMDTLRGGLGIGQLGLGVLSYLDQSKTAGKERKLLDQQIDQNKFLISQAKQRQGDIAKSFGGGLAAKSANRVV
ncbi:MAG: hypothetical protein PVF17_02790 [Ignavibacteria bacterium]|jgi:hypothetical protein